MKQSTSMILTLTLRSIHEYLDGAIDVEHVDEPAQEKVGQEHGPGRDGGPQLLGKLGGLAALLGKCYLIQCLEQLLSPHLWMQDTRIRHTSGRHRQLLAPHLLVSYTYDFNACVSVCNIYDSCSRRTSSRRQIASLSS